jgi:predicted nuclease of predicted toxin-antitoxin system
VKLLFDENLSPRLAGLLADVYPGSAHVHACGLGSADDEVIWQYARDEHFSIVSKDSDFQERSVIRGHPPKVIWLHAANCATAEIESALRAAQPVITRFIGEEQESCLLLTRLPKSK